MLCIARFSEHYVPNILISVTFDTTIAGEFLLGLGLSETANFTKHGFHKFLTIYQEYNILIDFDIVNKDYNYGSQLYHLIKCITYTKEYKQQIRALKLKRILK